MFEFQPRAPILRDPVHQLAFERAGYVAVPLLDPERVDRIRAFHRRMYPSGVQGFASTTFDQDLDHRSRVDAGIWAEIAEDVDRVFQDYDVYACAFIVKAPGADSKLNVHQDMTLLDESRFSPTNIWCPLTDLDEANGALEVLPGSHRLTPTFRAHSIPDYYADVRDDLADFMVPIHVPAGTAVIFDGGLIHGSPANLSNEPRVVINSFVSHQDASIRICWHDPGAHSGQVEIFEQKDDFFRTYENFGRDLLARPAIGRSLGLVDYHFPKLTREQLEQHCGDAAPVQRVTG